MKRTAIALTLLVTVSAAGAELSPLPIVERAKKMFFTALNHDVTQRKAALRELSTAVAVAPLDPESNLYLGLSHLWIAAEGNRGDATLIDHVVLSDHYLRRAQRLNPRDQRIPSWLIPIQLSLAEIERDDTKRKQLYADMRAAYEADPNFHSFTLAMLGFSFPRGSEPFRTGLEALRKTRGCDENDPSCMNQPRWPHNREGFGLLHADYELRAGNRNEARQRLLEIQKLAAYPSWKFKSEVEDRLANLDDYISRYANDDPKDDPEAPLVSSNVQCQMCHAN